MNFKIFNFPLLICQIEEYPSLLINWLDGSSFRALHFFFDFFFEIYKHFAVFTSFSWIHSNSLKILKNTQKMIEWVIINVNGNSISYFMWDYRFIGRI